MQQKIHPLNLLALVPTDGGVAVFLHGRSRTFFIQVDPYQGQILDWYRQGIEHSRPLTHDLLSSLIGSIGGVLERVVIHEMKDDVYLAQMRVRCEDAMERQLILDLDCRPSDGLALAKLLDAPIYATDLLLDQVEDSQSLLEEIQHQEIEALLQPVLGNIDEFEEFDEQDFEDEYDDLFNHLDDEGEDEDEDEPRS